MYDDVKQALQDVVAPQLAEMRGEMEKWFAQKDVKITALRAEMEARLAKMDVKFSGQIAELRADIRAQGAEPWQGINNLHTDVLRIEERAARP